MHEWPDDWHVTKIGAITTKIGSGATPRGGKRAYQSDGIALIRSMNVLDSRFENKNLAFIDSGQAARLESVTVEPNDVLLNITGASVARCCLVPTSVLPARVNQHTAIVRANPELANAKFIMAALTSPRYKSRLLSIAQGGATREALTKEKIHNFEIVIPPLPVQRKIAGVLGAYDDLIEVNRRRIRVLEEMAQTIYREWFVEFRYPGHEPIGAIEEREIWDNVPFSDLAYFVNGFAFNSRNWMDEGLPIVKIRDSRTE